jgi:hypothetical protein
MHGNRRTVGQHRDRARGPRQVAKQITGHKTASMYTRNNIAKDTEGGFGLCPAYASLAALAGHNRDNHREQNTPSP